MPRHFNALSLLARAEQQEVDAQTNRKAAIAILEPLCQSAPNNPGPAHYMIHATDTSEFAAQGLGRRPRLFQDRSRLLACLAHALTHFRPPGSMARVDLFQYRRRRIGRQSTQEHRGEPHYQFHALDFLNYSYLQSGQESKAREMVKALENVPGASRKSVAEHQAWLAARNVFELHRWKEAAELPIPTSGPILRNPRIGCAPSAQLVRATHPSRARIFKVCGVQRGGEEQVPPRK